MQLMFCCWFVVGEEYFCGSRSFIGYKFFLLASVGRLVGKLVCGLVGRLAGSLVERD